MTWNDIPCLLSERQYNVMRDEKSEFHESRESPTVRHARHEVSETPIVGAAEE